MAYIIHGDYIEAYNPRAEGMSNDVLMIRTEPCIALYPSANRNGSWIMLNLNSNSYVRMTLEEAPCEPVDHIQDERASGR
jgi:hypothetical protein